VVTKQFPGLARDGRGRERGSGVADIGLSEESERNAGPGEPLSFLEKLELRRDTDHDQVADLVGLVRVEECDLVGRVGSLNKLLGQWQV